MGVSDFPALLQDADAMLVVPVVRELAIVGVPPQGQVGEAYSFTFGISGGNAPYSVAGTGTLPPGVMYDATARTFSASSLTDAGSWSYTVNVEDAKGRTVSRVFDFVVREVAPGPITLTDLTITPRPGPWTVETAPGAIIADVSGWHESTAALGRLLTGTSALALNAGGTAIVVAGGWPSEAGDITGAMLREESAAADPNWHETGIPTITVEAVEPEEPEGLTISGAPDDWWEGFDYPGWDGPVVENAVGDVTFALQAGSDDPADFGLVFNPATGGLDANGVLIRHGDGYFNAVIVATDDEKSATLTVMLAVKEPLPQFEDDFTIRRGDTTVAVANRISDSGHDWGAQSGQAFYVRVPENDLKPALNGSAHVFGFTFPSPDQTAVVHVKMGWQGLFPDLGGNRLAVSMRAGGGSSYRFVHRSTEHVDDTEPRQYYEIYAITPENPYRQLAQFDEGIPLSADRIWVCTIEDDPITGNVNLRLLVDGSEKISVTDTEPGALYGKAGLLGFNSSTPNPGPGRPTRGLSIRSIQAGASDSLVLREPETTYYVDNVNGDDENDGLTQLTAWKHAPGDTMATGLPRVFPLLPGDTVIIKGGEFYEGNLLRFQGSSDPNRPTKYIGDAWGDKRAILTDGIDVFDDLRKPVDAADAANCPFWEEEDFYILEHPGIVANQFALMFDKSGHYMIAAAPKPFFLQDIENLKQTATNGGYFYHHSDLPTRSWVDGHTGAKMRLPGLASMFANSLGAVTPYFRGGTNDLYSGGPSKISIDGDDVIFSGSTEDFEYNGPDNSGLFISFWNINANMVPGSVAVLEPGKLAIWLRPGATELRFTPWAGVGGHTDYRRALGANCIVEGFTFQGLRSGHAIRVPAASKLEGCFLADSYTQIRAGETRDLISMGDTRGSEPGKGAVVNRCTFTRVAGHYGARFGGARYPELHNLVFYDYASCCIGDSASDAIGTQDSTMNNIIIRRQHNIHKNPVVLYGTNGVIDGVTMSNVFMRDVERPLTAIQGRWRNMEFEKIFIQGGPSSEAAFLRSVGSGNQLNNIYLSDGVTENRNPSSHHTLHLKDMVILANHRGFGGSQNIKGVVFENAIINGKTGPFQIGTATPPKKNWKDDALEPWIGFDDINTTETWENYQLRPGLVLDQDFYAKFQLDDGTWVEIDLTDNPQDEWND